MTTSGGSENLTRALVDVTLHDCLESLRVSVRVEVHCGVDALFSVKVSEVVLDNGGLTRTGGTDIENTLVNGSMHVNEVVLSRGFSSRHHEVLEEAVEVSIEGRDLLGPGLELESCRAEEVVEAHTAFRELDLGHGSELAVERDSVL